MLRCPRIDRDIRPERRTSDCENNFDEDFDVENLSGSLEDLVGTFDQKISQCFKDLNEATEDLAPVQNLVDTDREFWQHATTGLLKNTDKAVAASGFESSTTKGFDFF
ncbi:unnamed protein product [Gongylonema pulchrum]|uniref:Vps53_N domain-containing protein n=1 Tax=Gongylonema pulchrum TaxID=637853 RepID=A0A183DYR5_9BILA|nr:unnamed protein product [Gongylonema pulchrum]